MCRREEDAEGGEDERRMPEAMSEPVRGLDRVPRKGTDYSSSKDCTLL